LSTSTKLARHIVRELIEFGIEEAVLSPGSRNAPLSIALYQAEEKGLIRLHVRIDERSAAFFALGISKASDKYVPVICTSGTAVANYLPAVLEAFHSEAKLLLLTADRPARLRRTGANQTTLQSGIFGQFVHHSIDTQVPIDLSQILKARGPVHVNLQFDEPLLDEIDVDWLNFITHRELAPSAHEEISIEIPSKRNVVIVGHDRAGFEVSKIEKFARELGAPIISEDPLSFKDAIAHAPIVLTAEAARRTLAAELTVVIGRTTLSRSTNSYIAESNQVLVIDPRAATIDTARTASRIFHAIPRVKKQVKRDDRWFEDWQKFVALASISLENYPAWSEGAIASLIGADLENDSALYISSSRPIRDLEAFATPRSGVTTYANRGLAGIDGNISTAMGIATHHDETYAIIGDLAFLHDVSALANPTSEALTIIVIDNNGGGIFSTLPQRGVIGFEKLFGTPHNQDLSRICTGFGISNEVVTTPKELQIALKRVHPTMHVIIAKVPDRESNADYLAEVLNRYRNSVAR
jgi:2-succinyl-5-enolpyruvyl-6-hydroxy-3-cyclohexene-1-carboxylate synthase